MEWECQPRRDRFTVIQSRRDRVRGKPVGDADGWIMRAHIRPDERKNCYGSGRREK